MSLHSFGTTSNTPPDPNNNNNKNIQPTTVQKATRSDVPEELIDYHKKAKTFKPVAFRDSVIEKILETLTTTKHPNVLLTGEAGVGKTAVVEELARRIYQKDQLVLSMLSDKDRIYELPITNIIAGGSLVGEIEKRVKEIIEFATDPKNHAILYIDEIHQLMNESDGPTNKVSQILKPALARGDIRVIASTTTQEARSLKRDPAFNRRFSTVIVPELSDQETYEILKQLKPDFEKHHHVTINDQNLKYVVTIADKYALSYQSHRPDTALTVLDQACARGHLQHEKMKLQNITVPSIISNKIIDDAALQLLNQKQQTSFDADTLRNNFNQHLIGQQDAKDALINDLAFDSLNLKERKRPHSYLFAGPTGVGKTELAKQLAKNLFGDENKMITLNMTEYSSPASLTRLIGSSRGYIGSESNQPLPLDTLISNPFQIVLLDEFEKAAPNVQRIFMQALDEGYIRLQNEQLVDFSHSIVIATTNAGADRLNQQSIGFNDQTDHKSSVSTAELVALLKQHFPIELLNRFEHLIVFNSLTKDEYKQVLKIKYNSLIQSASKLNQMYQLKPAKLDLDTDYNFIDQLADKSYNPAKNGRPAERTIYQAIAKQLLDHSNQTKFDFTTIDF